MTIQRRYEHDPEALERVAEILYRLLIDVPGGLAESSESARAEAQPPTCVLGESE
jgi:hypothetical protein